MGQAQEKNTYNQFKLVKYIASYIKKCHGTSPLLRWQSNRIEACSKYRQFLIQSILDGQKIRKYENI